MFRKKRTWIDDEIDRVVRVLNTHEPLSEKWLECCKRLSMLNELNYTRNSSVSKDVLATAAANLLGILMIIKHESVNVITSKALSFVIRPKV